jgi:rod shape-determining protein MreD
MSSFTPAALERLRPQDAPPRDRVRPQDAEVSTRPRLWWLLLAMLAAVVVQTTLLRFLSLRGAEPSLVTVLIVWMGLRYGVATAGVVGLFGGLIEDGLGSSGANVLGATLAGLGTGLLNVRFFADSLPVFVSAVAGATIVRAVVTYVVMDFALGERGMFHRYSHEVAWQVALNMALAALVVLTSRVLANARR